MRKGDGGTVFTSIEGWGGGNVDVIISGKDLIMTQEGVRD